MTIAARKRLVVLIFIAGIAVLWLMMPRDASAQNRKRDRDRRPAEASTPAASTAAVSTTGPAPRPTSDNRSISGSRSGASTPVPAYSDRFALLSQKNIFLRNRTRYSPRSTDQGSSGQSGNSYTRPPEESLVLTGIVSELGRPVALIENQSSGTTQRLTLGDPIARGDISHIELSFLEYETNDGQVTRVEIGRTFTGDIPAAPVAAAPTSAPATMQGEVDPNAPVTTAPAAAPGAIDPGKANLSIEEKMKLKRLQELKK